MSEIFGRKDLKKERLKEMVRRLHSGEDVNKVKEEFKELLKGLAPNEITEIEEELIKEGMPRDEIQKLCDVHISIFKESLESFQHITEEGHPVHTLMEEHRILLDFAGKLYNIISKMKDYKEIEEINHIIEHLKDSESHYVREENVLFPYLEKHGITQPPAIMWSEHNEIRKRKKEIYDIFENYKNKGFEEFLKRMKEATMNLLELLQSHFYKENNILFPTALKVIGESEWIHIRNQFDELGYCCFTPKFAGESKEKRTYKEEKEDGKIVFETGSFYKDEIETLLNTLPVDITFVDRDDTVRYFSQSKDRIFPRTKAVIGRKVQMCHPKESVDRVQRIIDDFKNNKRDLAEFWINLKGRLVYIRYFAVRKNGEYLGTLEVTQDITDIKKIEGEKRLLD
uniref:DUF438 domain-containing protein n=1 Tax=candidate division WOR-3 bacterium TaxID=2052148 RepID=A0A7C4U7E3_UNCW3